MDKPMIPTVSVIIPVYNSEAYLDECLNSIQMQQNLPDKFHVQISIYDDASTDATPEIIKKWEDMSNSKDRLIRKSVFSIVSGSNSSGRPKGAGFAKNRAIEQSTGEYFCFCDSDDVMYPNRIEKQYQLASQDPNNAIIGAGFVRIPSDSTKIFTRWANELTNDQLYTQIYQSYGPTLIMPTWFCHRSVFNRIHGGFCEKTGVPDPEDLIFFYQHLDAGGTLLRTPPNDPLMQYRYHLSNTTFSIPQEVIWRIRLERFETKVISNWNSFTIWNAGKLGRRFFRSLQKENQSKVKSFCDIDRRKIDLGFYHAPHPIKIRVPISHVLEALPPFVICVKTELTFDLNGDFNKILKSKNLIEGKDYYFFN